MQGVLTPAIKLLVFESPGGLQVPNFGSVSFILTLGQSGVVTVWFSLDENRWPDYQTKYHVM